MLQQLEDSHKPGHIPLPQAALRQEDCMVAGSGGETQAAVGAALGRVQDNSDAKIKVLTRRIPRTHQEEGREPR